MILNPSRMADPNGPTPDRDLVVDTLEGKAQTDLSLIAVYGATSFDIFHVGDPFRESFDDEAALQAHFSDLADEMRTEFFEHGLFAGLRPTHQQVEYRTRPHGDERLLQVYCGGRGMVVVLDAEEPVKPLVHAACQLLAKW